MVDHRFGGDWTDGKIDLVARYLSSYTTALKRQKFQLMYIDAFAGTGSRTIRKAERDLSWLPELPEVDAFVQGSARAAIAVSDPPIDKLVFIEKDRERFSVLKTLGDEFPDRHADMTFIKADANQALQKLCRETSWRNTRAVAFLDPYGMQVEWRTIEALAATKAIDMWYLFPVGMGPVRMTPKSGKVPEAWEQRLDLVFGDPGWRQAFYSESLQDDLFEKAAAAPRKNTDVEVVERYLLKRLRTCFAGVAKRGWRIVRQNQCMYTLVFAVGNPSPKATGLALKFANYLIDEKHRMK